MTKTVEDLDQELMVLADQYCSAGLDDMGEVLLRLANHDAESINTLNSNNHPRQRQVCRRALKVFSIGGNAGVAVRAQKDMALELNRTYVKAQAVLDLVNNKNPRFPKWERRTIANRISILWDFVCDVMRLSSGSGKILEGLENVDSLDNRDTA